MAHSEEAALITLLTLGLCWTHWIGDWWQQRKAKRVFRYGFDYLRQILLNAG